MPHHPESRRQSLLAEIIAEAEVVLGTAEASRLAPFLAAYYARVPLADIAGIGPRALVEAAIGHWQLGTGKPPDKAVLRVFAVADEVWRPAGTIIEVVNDDMPFIVDSLSAEINRRDLAVYLVIHPVVTVVRDGAGVPTGIAGPGEAGSPWSFLRIHLGRLAAADRDDLAQALGRVLADVRHATTDLQPIRRRLRAMIVGLPDSLPGQTADELDEVSDFLSWLYETNFTFLGYRAYRLERTADGRDVARVEPGSGLGILRALDVPVFADLVDGAPLPPAARAFLGQPEPLAVTKASRRATVHRPALMDTIVVKRYANEDGPETTPAPTGAHIIVGLFGSAAYTRSARAIPLLRRKIALVTARAGFVERSHDCRALINILETFPRDELFQVSADQLLEMALGILDLQQRPRVKLFVRRDEFERFVSCLVYLPRDRYTTDLRLAVQAILERAFAATLLVHYTQVSDAPHARLHLYLRTRPGTVPAIDLDDIETALVAATRSWDDDLRDILLSTAGEADGEALWRRYGGAFPPGYRERFGAAVALADIALLERVRTGRSLEMALDRAAGEAASALQCKVFHADRPIPLSDVLPVLENLGLRVIDEVPHQVRLTDPGSPGQTIPGQTVVIHDFGLVIKSGRSVDPVTAAHRFFAAFRAVWEGRAESDQFNALVLEAGLDWQEVVVVRAYARYLRQAGIYFSQRYIEQAVIANPEIAARIVGLFRARLQPGLPGRDARAETLRAEIAALLDRVASADDDRILRRFVNLVEATLRTSFFKPASDPAGDRPAALALKLDSTRIEDLPLPRPMVEIFVYTPEMEGIHLRGGPVSRGGIRWSDRREDFRSEVLGLMKAQTVKNAVIVPVGAKGGFVLKRPPDPADRDATQAAGIAAYRLLIEGLLDLTDNRIAGRIVTPADVERRDGDDPYLVVAADKGTASFSDIANAIALDRAFWLGDAFASGGSQGYDHKKLGITAKGAWESVKRHFREMGRDVDRDPFTVVGVGDMSGDVFGNGMLLSPKIRLVAAFDHRHVFVDPTPDPALALAERERLFRLPRSSWADFDPALLSAGGRVFPRSAKMLALTPEIRQRFAIHAERVTPAELIRVLLQADVDLLWFGGIGTFVKAADENHADAGDRSNDPVRVDAERLRCKVVAEGANLGITQRGRIAFAMRGGRINTDFIDNSAGVDCSDHEVNIKILLDAAVAAGELDAEARNRLLSEMTDSVAALVLHDNYAQTQAISLILHRARETLENQARLMRVLERQGRLDRAVEFLPDDETLAERGQAKQGLTRPEIAVLFSHTKIWLKAQILASDLPDDRHLADDIVRYFPAPIGERFPAAIPQHPLRRDLMATMITNSLVNRMGMTFVTDVAETTGAAPADIARAYIVARDVFVVRPLWHAIEALDGQVTPETQFRLYGEIHRLIERGTLWFLRHGGQPIDLSVNIAAFDTAVATLAARLDAVLPQAATTVVAAMAAEFAAAGVPADLAGRIALLDTLPAATDLVRLAAARGVAVDKVAALYFAAGDHFGFDWLRRRAEATPAAGYWQRLAIAALVDELDEQQHRLVEGILAVDGSDPAAAIAAWTAAHARPVDRALALVAELRAAQTPVDLSMLTVASRQLRALTEA